jgi:hypothetical protein
MQHQPTPVHPLHVGESSHHGLGGFLEMGCELEEDMVRVGDGKIKVDGLQQLVLILDHPLPVLLHYLQFRLDPTKYMDITLMSTSDPLNVGLRMRKAAVSSCLIFLYVSSALHATNTAVSAISSGGYFFIECFEKKTWKKSWLVATVLKGLPKVIAISDGPCTTEGAGRSVR